MKKVKVYKKDVLVEEKIFNEEGKAIEYAKSFFTKPTVAVSNGRTEYLEGMYYVDSRDWYINEEGNIIVADNEGCLPD